MYWPDEAIRLLETGAVAEISLNHDLGDAARGTSYDVILWIEAAVALRGLKPPRITVHAANPSAGDKMRAGVLAIERRATAPKFPYVIDLQCRLDASFDSEFSSRPNLRWWPWVGSNFSACSARTIVLGESVYNWGDGFDARYQRTDGLRETHRRHALSYQRGSPYVRNIERAIYGASSPRDDQKRAFWSSVAYHNLVLEPLANLTARPSHDQYVKGWHEFFDLSHLMAIDQGIVYGLEGKKINALKEALKLRGASFQQSRGPVKVGRTRPRVIAISDNGRAIKLLFIRHPSAFFSWRRWAPVIREHFPSQFEVTDTVPVLTA